MIYSRIYMQHELERVIRMKESDIISGAHRQGLEVATLVD